MNAIPLDPVATKIPGWGSDLPLANRPGVPREAPSETGAHWVEPDQQPVKVKIFRTVERPGVTPVFGTTCPPKGLSGWIRERAYRLGEGRPIRWMILMAADRIDVIESFFGELISGREPQSKRSRLTRRVAAGAVLTLLGGGLVALAIWM